MNYLYKPLGRKWLFIAENDKKIFLENKPYTSIEVTLPTRLAPALLQRTEFDYMAHWRLP
jgi:hypothetical protein